ncbi:MAG: WG repeat-containing protein [Brevinema sp.]
MRLFDAKQFLLIIMVPVALLAQGVELFPYPSGGKWGYINTQGRIHIEPTYDAASSFSSGLGRIGKIVDGEFLYGFINASGQEVIQPKFLQVSDFHQGLAAVKIREKYAYLLPNGEISKDYFDQIYPVSENMSRFRDNGLYGFVSNTARIVIPASFAHAENFQNGLAVVKVGGSYGYVNPKGDLTIPPRFDMAENFNDGYAPVQEKRAWYLINKQGERQGTRTFDRIYSFNSGLARVRRGNLYGYIDSTGEIVIPISFKEADDFSHGLAIVSTGNRLYGYINTRGEMIAPFTFTRATRFDGTFARVSQGNSHGFMNGDGKFNLTDKIVGMGSFFNKRSRVRVGRYYGFFDDSARLQIRPTFLQAGEFRRALTPVLSAIPGGYRAGYINAAGTEVFSWNILPKVVPALDDQLYVISYPSLPFYKGDDPTSLVILHMDYGATMQKTLQRTATPLIGLGLQGLLYSVRFYNRPGFVFSEAVSVYPPPRIGMGILSYFQDVFGVLSSTAPLQSFDRNIFVAFFNGSVLNRNLQRNLVQDTYFIPFMKINESFFIFSAAMGYPSSTYPLASGKLSNFMGHKDEASFTGVYNNDDDAPSGFTIRVGREKITVSRQGSQGIQLVHEYPKPMMASTTAPADIVFGGVGPVPVVVETNEIIPAEQSNETIPLEQSSGTALSEEQINITQEDIPEIISSDITEDTL